MITSTRYLLLVLTFIVASPSSAESVPSTAGTSRPTVGLVLGGGGARGAAHIGVLRELERMRIPIDAIAGTSIGAIVGGLYASGMSVAELEILVASLDWKEAFTDGLARENLRYRRKQDDAAFPIGLELGFRGGEILLPKGVLQGQKLGLILRELTLGVSQVSDFDDLAIPYRAVASDIVTGDAVVIGEGDLATAIRASMSAPGIFAPVELNGKTLVDGGLVGNVPVRAMRDMGVDIIIAVDVEFPLYEPEELQTAVSISAQMLTILIQKETRRQLELLGENDFLIRPELGNFGSTDFAEIVGAIEPGAIATREKESKLSVLSLGEPDYAAHIAARSEPATPKRLEFVRVRDDGTLSSAVIESRLETRVGDSVSSDTLARDAARIHGLQLYEQVDYQLVEEDGKSGVEFTTRPKGWGPNFLQFGLSLQDDLDGDTAFNISARLTRAGINSFGAEWRTDLQLGTDPFVFSEFYQPIGANSRFFVAPRIAAESRNLNVYLDGNNAARIRVSDAEIGLDAGAELGLWGEFRVGAFRGTGKGRQKIGPSNVPESEFETGGIFTQFNVDTLDNAQIPLKGTRATVEWISSKTSMGAADNFDTVDGKFSAAWTHGRHTINGGVRYATSRASNDLIRNYFRLGGFLNMSGVARGEISGPHAAFARLIYYRRSGQIKGEFDVPLYIGGSLEVGNAWQSRSDISADTALLNGSVFLGLDTYIGPVFLAAGFGEGGNRSFYLSFGTNREL